MWSNIIGQEKAKEILKNYYRSGKIPHALIFYGDEGIGKDAAAVEFAKLLNCDEPANENEACDKCKNCVEINSFRSPLVKFVIALPAGKNETNEDSRPLEKLDKEDFPIYLEEMEAKINDKYHKISIPGANDIRISSIRQIKREIYLTGRTGKKKVFIISNCDMMNPQSANSLLKILEEPPKDSILILTTSKINSLLPTILGRCQKIRFSNLSKDLILNYIKDKDEKIKSAEAEFISQLSDGSITKCNEILGRNFVELRERVLELLGALLTNQYLKLGTNIDFVIGKKDKERVKQFLILLSIWFRDISNKSYGNEDLIINKDKAERISRFVSNFDSDNYKIISLIEEAIRDIDSNVILDLLLYNLSYKIKSHIRKKIG